MYMNYINEYREKTKLLHILTQVTITVKSIKT